MLKLIKIITLTCLVTNLSSLHAMKKQSCSQPFVTHHYNEMNDIYCKVNPQDNTRTFAQKFNPGCTHDLNEAYFRGFTEKNGTIVVSNKSVALYYELKAAYHQQQLHNSKL